MRLGGFMIAAENCGKVAERGKPRSISDAQQVFPFAKVAPEAHAFRDLECRDHTPFDLLAGLSGVSQVRRCWSAAFRGSFSLPVSAQLEPLGFIIM
jgi:hypothetical protein